MSFTKFPRILLVLTVLTCFSIPIFVHAHNTATIDNGFTHGTTGDGITAYKATFEDPNDPRMGNHFHVKDDQVLAFRGQCATGTSACMQAPTPAYYVSDLELETAGFNGLTADGIKVTGDSNENGRNDNAPEEGVQVTFEITVGGTSNEQTQTAFTDAEGRASPNLPVGFYNVIAKVLDEEIYFNFIGGLTTTSTSPSSTTRNALSSNALPQSDDDIDNNDLLLAIAMNFGENPTGDLARYDVDGDGDIDIDDFLLVQAQLGQNGNPGAPAASHTLSDTLEHIKGLNITDPEFQRVIQLLEKRAAELNPKKTTLLANYPNPFNPETWIPYRLAKDADVTLTIYAINGEVVRSLALGHQSVGSYLDRTRAAYWDGKNAFGEPVASGLYFYTLTADDFSATRRMLIAK